MNKRALITGIGGQDGYYLTEHLLKLGYEVFGIIRRHGIHESEAANLNPFLDKIRLLYGDLIDVTSIESAMHIAQPHEIYNLAAQSHVRVSFDMPQYTAQVNAIGTLNLLEAVRKIVPYAKVYQASTSEMFGNQIDPDNFQRETTPMIPVSPYGASKLFAHNLIHQYRNSYGMFCCSGILFNHESPLRGGNFVTQKVVRGAVAIHKGKATTLELGNLTACRDWGHARDYTKAMHLMLQQEIPDDFVISTGVTHTIQELVEFVFGALDIKWQNHVSIKEVHKRPEDVNFLRGDCTKAKTVLGWKQQYDFQSTLTHMINAEGCSY